MGIEYRPYGDSEGIERKGPWRKGESDSYRTSFGDEAHSSKSQLTTTANMKGKQQTLMQTRGSIRGQPGDRAIINHNASSSATLAFRLREPREFGGCARLSLPEIPWELPNPRRVYRCVDTSYPLSEVWIWRPAWSINPSALQSFTLDGGWAML